MDVHRIHSLVNSETKEMTQSYKYLRTLIDYKLTFHLSSENLSSECQPRLYFLCKTLQTWGFSNSPPFFLQILQFFLTLSLSELLLSPKKSKQNWQTQQSRNKNTSSTCTRQDKRCSSCHTCAPHEVETVISACEWPFWLEEYSTKVVRLGSFRSSVTL